MYTGIFQAHSGWRYILLLLLIAAIVKALIGWFGKKEFTAGDNKLSLFAMIATHIQLLLGLVLYPISPNVRLSNMAEVMKDETLRLWTVEHISMMIVAVALITVGRIVSKKNVKPTSKHMRVAIFYLLGLLTMLSAIPKSAWPGM